jgi:hypothetical protein
MHYTNHFVPNKSYILTCDVEAVFFLFRTTEDSNTLLIFSLFLFIILWDAYPPPPRVTPHRALPAPHPPLLHAHARPPSLSAPLYSSWLLVFFWTTFIKHPVFHCTKKLFLFGYNFPKFVDHVEDKVDNSKEAYD